MQPAIHACTEADCEAILSVINDAARAYAGVIPEDCWHDPYMTLRELRSELDRQVVFHGTRQGEALVAVAGIQDKSEVALVRHAYVATAAQRKGCGSALLAHLERTLPDKPLLVGTWADARWAIDFYRKAGYTLLPTARKNALLKTYWTIPQRQIDTSVVLAKRLPASG